MVFAFEPVTTLRAAHNRLESRHLSSIASPSLSCALLSPPLSLWLLIIITVGMSIINAKTHRKTHFVLSLMAAGCTLRLTKGSFDQLHHCSLLSFPLLPSSSLLPPSSSPSSSSTLLSFNVYYFTTRTSDSANGPLSLSLSGVSSTRETKRK